jgi:hypothetical protein
MNLRDIKIKEHAKNALKTLHLFQFACALIHFPGAAKLQYSSGGSRNLLRFFGAKILQILAIAFQNLGKSNKRCPCCGWRGLFFLPYIDIGYVTFGTECPNCKSHGRHRGQWLFYEKKLLSLKGELLYFATEPNTDYFRNMPDLIVKTSEYSKSVQADFHYDILDIDCPSLRWDYIICHRVIEHLSDDVRGMKELFRILKPEGILIMSVPMDPNLENTIEYGKPNPFISGHYYDYGKDFPSRIPSEFKVHTYVFSEIFSKSEFYLHGLIEDYIFLCMK